MRLYSTGATVTQTLAKQIGIVVETFIYSSTLYYEYYTYTHSMSFASHIYSVIGGGKQVSEVDTDDSTN